MATNDTNVESLVAAAQLTHNNATVTVANVLDQVNPFVQDAPMTEAIDITSHTVFRTTALPDAEFVKVGSGPTASTGQYSQSRLSLIHI